jgi:ADP-ribose pyrophosphatase YjhB (NUDIX family)
MAMYRTFQPRVTIGAVGVVFNTHGKLLIVEHVFHPQYPWGLPGGWMARSEEPAETVRREIFEETSLRVKIIKPLAISQTPFITQHLDVAFLCKLSSGMSDNDIQLSSELLDYQWITPDKAPPMALFHVKVVEAAVLEWQQLQYVQDK